MKWEEFQNLITPESQFIDLIKTTVECPKCGSSLYYRANVVLTSYPAQYKYECPGCGLFGYSHAKWQERLVDTETMYEGIDGKWYPKDW